MLMTVLRWIKRILRKIFKNFLKYQRYALILMNYLLKSKGSPRNKNQEFKGEVVAISDCALTEIALD